MAILSDTAKKMILSLAGLTLIALGIGCMLIGINFFFSDNILYYIIGLIVGYVFNVLKVFMMSASIEKAVDMTPKDAKAYARLQYTSRYFLTLAVLVAACMVPFIDVVGVVIELLLLQFASYITNFLLNKQEKAGKLN